MECYTSNQIISCLSQCGSTLSGSAKIGGTTRCFPTLFMCAFETGQAQRLMVTYDILSLSTILGDV